MREQRISFGSFVFDRGSATLWQGDTLVPVGGRGAAILDALLEAENAVVAKAALMERAWHGMIVEDGNLAVQIATLRKVLGRRPDGDEWITTVARVGYRLLREGPGAKEDGRPAIAVLPFVNMSSNPEQDYFADGLVEDLITGLSRFKSFAVVARNSSFAYKGRAIDIRQVGRELGVRYVLEGSVRRKKDQIRISAQLIEGSSGAHIWAENFDGTLADVFDVQDRITENVVGVVEPKIRWAEIERARRKRPENLDAYDFYLQGLPHIQDAPVFRLDDYDDGIALFEQAIALDPTFAPALAYCAWCHEKRVTRGGAAPRGVNDAERAIALADRALKADGADPVVMMIAGVVAMTIKGDLEAGSRLIRQANALNPNSPLISNVAAYAHYLRGDYDAAIACNLRAIDLNPGSPAASWALNGIARANISAGRVEEALTWALRACDGPVDIDFAHGIVAAAYALLGRGDEARAAIEHARLIWPHLTINTLVGADGRPEDRDKLLIEGLLKAGLARD
jgi:TolB-like protein/Flp pilus assembly protein TadD